jgi:pyrroloquinoline quinone (PQQ) biosynthesis protein C
MKSEIVLKKMDEIVDRYAKNCKLTAQDFNMGRARTFVKQHRMNTRQRNSVLKLRVATNCPDWDTKLHIIHACSQEIIADNEFAHGKPHWQVIEELGTYLGLKVEDIRATKPLPTTQIAWAAWAGLMSNSHWLEGIVGNTCAERVNVPGYGTGLIREVGWSGVQRQRWPKLFGLTDGQLEFFSVHEEADKDHSNLGWDSVARFAEECKMEEAVVHACEVNLSVWEMYFNGIADEGDRINA